MNLLKRDLAKGLEAFIDQTEPYRSSWVQRRIRVESWPRESFRLPSWQAHRGYWVDGAPQNTLESLIRAREMDAKMCEFDVRLTRDGVPVLFHDPSLSMEGDDREGAWQVRDLTFRELQGRVGDQFNLCRLREVLESSLVPEFLNIELKSEDVWNEPLERIVADEVIKTGAAGRVLFSSFNPFSIWKISNWLPEVPRALLVSPESDYRSLREMWWAPFLKIHLLHLDKVMVNEVSMRFWRQQNVPIGVWTATTREEMNRLWNLGAATVISDCLPHPLGQAPESPSAL